MNAPYFISVHISYYCNYTLFIVISFAKFFPAEKLSSYLFMNVSTSDCAKLKRHRIALSGTPSVVSLYPEAREMK